MTRDVWLIAVCAFVTGSAVAQSKVGIINYQEALMRTEEGQKTAKTLEEKYAPRQAELEKKMRELEDLKAQGRKGQNTMSEEARTKLIRDIDQKEKALTRDSEDAKADFQQEQNKLFNAIYQKMRGEVDKYAKNNGYAVILDVSSPENPVVFALTSVDITDEIVAAYNKGQGSSAASAPSASAPAAAPAAKPPAVTLPKPPGVATPKSTAPPPTRKQ